MTDLDDFRNRFSKQLDHLRDTRQRENQQTLSQLYPELAGPLQNWERGLQQREIEYQQETVTRPSPPPVILSAHANTERAGRFATWQNDLDRMMLDKLEFGFHPLPKGFAAPVRWLDTPSALLQELAANLPDLAQSAKIHERRGIFHLPGQGTCINLTYYERMQGLSQAEQRELFITDLARERWGWGFMLEYTTLGQAAGQEGLWPALSARHVFSGAVQGKEWERADVLQQSWMLLKIGWCEWISQFAQNELRRSTGQDHSPGFSLARMLELLKGIMDAFPWIINLAGGVRIHPFNFIKLVKFLFFEQGDLLTRGLHDTLRDLKKFSLQHDASISQTIGIRLSEVLAHLYMAQLEAVLGVLSTPYAVLISMHAPALAHQPDASAMLALLEKDLRASPDTRLALLARSDSHAKYDPHAMSVAAWERFHFESPREYFHP